MWISKYVCCFMIFSFMGWIYETIFCTIKGKKWENRGFLFGPVCPIYGTGAIAISVIMNRTSFFLIELSSWQIFIISVIGSAVLEYVTSWGLEKLFHALWWDYSGLPLNIHGRISFFTSLGFGVAGLLVVYYISPFTETAMGYLSPIVIEFLALIFCFLFAVDLTLTVNALLHFDRVITNIESSFNKNMEMVVNSTIQQSYRIKNGVVEKGHAVNYQIASLSSFVKGTVRRVNFFRYREKMKENSRNYGLSMIRTIWNDKKKGQQ